MPSLHTSTMIALTISLAATGAAASDNPVPEKPVPENSTPESHAQPNEPPPRIRAWMERLTVDHTYDPATGFIVAREVIALPPVIADAPPLDRCVELSAETGRVLIAIATADRCAPCQQYKKSALNDPRVVAAFGDPRILVTHVEVDRKPELADRYLGGRGIPMTYLVRDGEATERLLGQRSAEELLAWLDDVTKLEALGGFDRDTAAWHADRLQRLTRADGWLTLTGLAWLEDGEQTIGRAEGADIRYEGLPDDQLGTLVVRDDDVRLRLTPGATAAGLPDDARLRPDADGDPTVVRSGSVSFHVIERGGRLALRIKDANARARVTFDGIDRFPADARWRIEADFEPSRSPQMMTLPTVVGTTAETRVAGRARFEIEGQAFDAALFHGPDDGFYLRFADGTNGSDTYAVGRYLYVPPPTDAGRVTLDFNRAYNPPCAFTPYATCTIPPDANTFAVPITAGERAPRGVPTPGNE